MFGMGSKYEIKPVLIALETMGVLLWMALVVVELILKLQWVPRSCQNPLMLRVELRQKSLCMLYTL